MNAVYMMISNGSTAVGGIVWGAAATFYRLDWAPHGASILLLFSRFCFAYRLISFTR
jgi:hypothetical protein